MKSMPFRHVWIWTDLGNGVRRFQGIGFGGHQGSRILVERASGFEDLALERAGIGLGWIGFRIFGVKIRGFGFGGHQGSRI